MLKAVLFDLDQTLMDWSQVEPWEDYQWQRIMALLDYARDRAFKCEPVPLAARSVSPGAATVTEPGAPWSSPSWAGTGTGHAAPKVSNRTASHRMAR